MNTYFLCIHANKLPSDLPFFICSFSHSRAPISSVTLGLFPMYCHFLCKVVAVPGMKYTVGVHSLQIVSLSLKFKRICFSPCIIFGSVQFQRFLINFLSLWLAFSLITMVFPMFALQTPTAYISQLSEPSQAEGILQYLHVQVYITYSATEQNNSKLVT